MDAALRAQQRRRSHAQGHPGRPDLSQSISSSVRGEGATLDRFGMRNVTQGGHAQIIYLDDLKYTAPPTATLAPPTGLSPTAGDQSVALDWADNTESDLAGYNVYRATTPGGPYTKLNTHWCPRRHRTSPTPAA